MSSLDSLLSTFLLTDIEGSTRLWEEYGDTMGAALAVHDRLLRGAIESCHGQIVKTTGDGMLAVFEDPTTALSAALAAQRVLRDTAWGATGPLRVRMAIHSGPAESRDGDYFGQSLNRDARILAIGHGGQVLMSAATAVLTGDRLPAAVELVDLGSHRLRDLDRPEQIFQLVAADLPREFPPLRSLSTRRSNLPVQLTSFVGREKELEEVQALAGRARLVTLIGTGGTGKTRLMLEAGANLAGLFADGAWVAELAPLGDPAQIAPEIARALGAPEVAGRPAMETVTDFLAAKELLLLLDNAEHLIDGVAEIAEQLLASAPRLRILTTSREALAVSGEVMIQVPSLSCPMMHGSPGQIVPPTPAELEAAAATEAVRLFVERASAVHPGFELNAGNVVAVSEICRRLDGIPLAVELAAARVSAMSPEEIASGLGDRFRLLTGGRRTAVPRQQTLHALVDWSWDLLTEDDRRLLRRLSIFAGGWTAGAASAVVADPDSQTPGGANAFVVVDGLSRLVDRSLVVVNRGATTRYRMLETIRQYAREKLIASGEAASVSDLHFSYFSALAEAADPELRGPSMADWLDRLDADAENLDAALEWGLESAPETAVRMCISMLTYWRVRVPAADTEVRVLAAIAAARAIVAGPPDPTTSQRALAARLLGRAAEVWGFADRGATALEWGLEAVPLARSTGDASVVVDALTGFAVGSVFAGERGDLRATFDEVIQLATETADAFRVATLAAGMAGGVLAQIDPPAAELLLIQAREAARKTGNPFAIGLTAMGQGRLDSFAGRTDEAIARLGEAIGRFSEIGDSPLLLASQSDSGHALRRGGRLDEAMATYAQAIGGWVRFGARGAVANQLEQIAFVAIQRAETSRAARLLGAAEVLRELANSPMVQGEESEYLDFVERLRGSMPADAFATNWAEGRTLSMTDAVAVAVGG